MPIISEKEKSGTYSKATKGTTRSETGISCKGRSAGKKVEKNRGRRSGICS